MKTMIFLFSLFAVANVAQASQTICGELTTVNVAPVCHPGEMCPHIIRVEHILTDASGAQTILETASNRVLSEMMSLDTQNVCATGKPEKNGSFEVTSITAEN